MDVSLPPLAPRAVQDLRPAADAAATARIDQPPVSVAVGPVIAPASSMQAALVPRDLLGTGTVAPCAASGRTQDGASPGRDQPPTRVLKPWGVEMLPADKEPDDRSGRGGDASGPREGRTTTETASPDPGTGGGQLASHPAGVGAGSSVEPRGPSPA